MLNIRLNPIVHHYKNLTLGSWRFWSFGIWSHCFHKKTFKTQNKKVKHKFQDIGLKNIKRNDERIGT